MALTRDSRRAASGGYDRRIIVWNLPTYSEIATFTADAQITGIAWLPDGNGLFAGDALDRIHLLELVEPSA